MDKTATVLFVDDEQGILNVLMRLFSDDGIRVLTSTSGSEGLNVLRNNDVSVIVSDNLMPGMTGIDFLSRAKGFSPDSVRIMLTGYAEVQLAIDAINKGEVYKFITKPWVNDELRNVVLDSINRHRIVRSLRKADEYALYSLAQTIELKDPYTKGHCDRVAQYALSIAEAMGLDEGLREGIKHGGWLHDCGKIGVPESVLNLKGSLSPDQMNVVKKHPCWGADVARLAHLSEIVVNVILSHHERYDGRGYPQGLKAEEIPIEARIVNVADTYDALTSERAYRSALSPEEAMKILQAGKGSQCDPVVVDAFVEVLAKEQVDTATKGFR